MSIVGIKVKGAYELQKKFNRLARKVKNKKVIFKRIGVRLLNEIDRTFKTETWEGQPWQELSEKTIKARRKGPGVGSPRILQDTGTLRRSFVYEADDKKVRIGTPIIYAPTHEFGRKFPKPAIPRRRMLPSQERALEIAVEVTDNYLDESIKRSGL